MKASHRGRKSKVPDIMDPDSSSAEPEVPATVTTASASLDLALSTEFRHRVRPVLNRIDQLRAHGLQGSLPLPMVAVVGDQSVGKSSVLEAISGIELPRGTGIVTRCPLQLAMRSGEKGDQWRGRITYTTVNGEKIDRVLNSPGEVGQAVREAQDAMTDGPGRISSEQIHLSVESDGVPDLTLLDLPGIARFSSTGGVGIAEQTKQLISNYICQQQVIILVVVPCHVDIETVEALSLAKTADPNGERTIGVMTCPDMVNKGAEGETMQIALNQKIRLEKGYVVVRCRNPEELRNKVQLADCIAIESKFFATHEYFSQLPSESVGVPNLAKKLVDELFFSIKKNMKQLQEDIAKLKKSHELELQKLGPSVGETTEEKRRILYEMITEFVKRIDKSIAGDVGQEYQLYSRCRKHWVKLQKEIEAAWPAWIRRHSSQQLWYAPELLSSLVSDLRGRELPGYDYIFPIIERVYKREFLENLKDPAQQMLESVTDEVNASVAAIAADSFAGFDELRELVEICSEEEVEKLKKEAKQDIQRLFSQEERVFTQDGLFQLKMSKIEEKLHKNSVNDQQCQQDEVSPDSTERIRRGVEAYLQVASDRLADTIPLSVLYYMLKLVSDRVSHRTMQLQSEIAMEKLVREDASKTARRKLLAMQLQQLQQAEKEFSRFRVEIK